MDCGTNELKYLRRTGCLLICLAALLFTFCGQEDPQSKTESLEKRLEQLRSVPYTSLTEEAGGESSGVLLHDQARTWPGYNLYCSRTSPEAYLIDMNGADVHRWSYSQADDRTWDHALMLEGGDLIVLNKFVNIFKLDRHSNLIWERPLEVHHEIVTDADGNLYVIQRERKPYRGVNVRFASILHLDHDGNTLNRWSTYDSLDEIREKFDRRSFLDNILDALEEGDVSAGEASAVDPAARRLVGNPKVYDYFHLNAVTLLPDTPLGRKDPRFAEGNLLICLRNVNQIAVLDRASKEIRWVWGEGELEWPHHPTMVGSGNIMVFDNGVIRGYSRVLEVNPLTGKIEWEYIGSPPPTFHSPRKGSAQRLPNGNTLICEGDRGRTFEVTSDGETVWNWLNPHLEEGRRVQVYRMIRYDREEVEAWLGE
jgi:hypothetical protein